MPFRRERFVFFCTKGGILQSVNQEYLKLSRNLQENREKGVVNFSWPLASSRDRYFVEIEHWLAYLFVLMS
jgi:hypothetical protein